MQTKSELKLLYQQSQLVINNLITALEAGGAVNPIPTISAQSGRYTAMLTLRDKTMCTQRFEWKLPINLTSQELEGYIYNCGTICAFKNASGVLQFARFAESGKLNDYGRLTTIQPITFGGKKLNPRLTVISVDGDDPPAPDADIAVLIHDYTPDFESGICTPRRALNGTTTIADETVVFAQLINNITLSIKRALALCENEDQKTAVIEQVKEFFLSASPIIPIIKKGDKKGVSVGDALEMFNFDNTFDTSNYAQTIDFYDKFRRKCNGIPCPDIFEKKERMISSETENSDADARIVLANGLAMRQNACQLINKYLGISISVDICEDLKPKAAQKQTGDNMPEKERKDNE